MLWVAALGNHPVPYEAGRKASVKSIAHLDIMLHTLQQISLYQQRCCSLSQRVHAKCDSTIALKCQGLHGRSLEILACTACHQSAIQEGGTDE